jgi:hypothetical protein
MENKPLIAVGAAALLLIIAISLIVSNQNTAIQVRTTTTTPGTTILPDASNENEALSSIQSEWSNETDYVEIGEMI